MPVKAQNTHVVFNIHECFENIEISTRNYFATAAFASSKNVISTASVKISV